MCWLCCAVCVAALVCCSVASPQAVNLDPTASDAAPSDCVCVHFYLCKNNTLNVHGSGVINPRLKPKCADITQVCCSLPDQVTTTSSTEKSIPTAPPTLPPTETPGTPISRSQTGCGYRNPDGVGLRIVGGVDDNDALFGEFPWVVAVFVAEEQLGLHYRCGGALIHPQVVLTTAHCALPSKRGRPLHVRAGEWDMSTVDESLPHQERAVAEVRMHPHFRSGTAHHNLALLFLDSAFVAADNVDMVCLPPTELVASGTDCWVAGWGSDARTAATTTFTSTLKKVQLPIVAHSECEQRLRTVRPGFTLHSSFVCAGGEPGKDACRGDGGSPLVCPVPGAPQRYQMVGAVSWGVGCGNATPALYTNVAALRAWVDEQLAAKQIDSSTYTY